MADQSLSPQSPWFNRPDEEPFWEFHAVWRLVLDQGIEGEAREMAFTDMMALGVASCRAIFAKQVALGAMPAAARDMATQRGVTVGEVLQWDCERAAKREAFGIV